MVLLLQRCHLGLRSAGGSLGRAHLGQLAVMSGVFVGNGCKPEARWGAW